MVSPACSGINCSGQIRIWRNCRTMGPPPIIAPPFSSMEASRCFFWSFGYSWPGGNRALWPASRLPFDRTADRRGLVRDHLIIPGDFPHGFDEFAPRAGGRRAGAAFVETSAIFQLAVGTIAEKIRRAD